MKHNFEQRRQNRIEYAKLQAIKNQQKSEHLYVLANKMASVIPLGQPILIGHHSEKRDRNYRERIHNTFGHSVNAEKKAAYYEDKAKTIESNDAIFSDDPNALQKLREKLEQLTHLQTFMRDANKCIRKGNKDAFLQLKGATEKNWATLNIADRCHGKGFPHYKLQNNNAEIRRVKQRLAILERNATLKTEEFKIGAVILVRNMEANRVQLFFPAIPAEEFRRKMSKNGFRFSRSEGNAWLRHYSPWAFNIAKALAAEYAPEQM